MLDAAAGEGGEHCGLDRLTYALTLLNVRLDCLRSGLDCLIFLLDRNGMGACTTRRLENVGSTAAERMRAVIGNLALTVLHMPHAGLDCFKCKKLS